MIEHVEHCALFDEEVERFAEALSTVGAATVVPTCPEWTVDDLARHLGSVHRWAEALVRNLSERPTAQPRVDEPVTPGWIREGGRSLSRVLLAADPDAGMWAWGLDQHVRFWSRRQLHETLVHRMDLELVAGRRSQVDQRVAADAIDELLVNLPAAARFSPGVRELRGEGQRLLVHPDDVDEHWTITLEPDGFSVDRRGAPADPDPSATLTGRAADLLALLYRRSRLDGGAVAVFGDRALVDFWLEHSALN